VRNGQSVETCCLQAKLEHVADAADVLRSARERLDELFPARN
jgi:hypothetical protein